MVIYMGVASAEAIAEKLIGDGLAPDTPLAVVENAARPAMRVLRNDLAGLAKMIVSQGVQAPAIIVIGAITARGEDGLRALALEIAQ